MPLKGKRMGMMAEKDERVRELGDVWTLEKHFPSMIIRFCVNNYSN